MNEIIEYLSEQLEELYGIQNRLKDQLHNLEINSEFIDKAIVQMNNNKDHTGIMLTSNENIYEFEDQEIDKLSKQKDSINKNVDDIHIQYNTVISKIDKINKLLSSDILYNDKFNSDEQAAMFIELFQQVDHYKENYIIYETIQKSLNRINQFIDYNKYSAKQEINHILSILNIRRVPYISKEMITNVDHSNSFCKKYFSSVLEYYQNIYTNKMAYECKIKSVHLNTVELIYIRCILEDYINAFYGCSMSDIIEICITDNTKSLIINININNQDNTIHNSKESPFIFKQTNDKILLLHGKVETDQSNKFLKYSIKIPKSRRNYNAN